MMMKPFSFRNNSKEDKKAIKFIQDNLITILIDNVNITITEIECNQPDCAPIEVLIILITENEKWAGKILKPLAEVTIDDVLDIDLPSWILKTNHINVPIWVKDAASELKQKLKELSAQDYTNSIAYLNNYFNDDSETNNEDLSMTSIKEEEMKSNVEEAEVSKTNVVSVQMVPKETIKVLPTPPVVRLKAITSSNPFDAPIRHKKGVRPRGCPCCDPDAADVLNFNGSI